jgi:hypothetical protein
MSDLTIQNMAAETTAEEWRPIPGADGFYSASSFGRIRSEPKNPEKVGKKYGRVLRPSADRKGYLWFRICLPGEKPRSVKVHRMVMLAFVGPVPSECEVNHKDGDKTNNRPENLEYKTGLENIRHAWENGLHANDDRKGEAHRMAKLNDEKVRAIRAAFPARSLGSLAEEHGVTKQAISYVLNRKTWSHI